MSSNEGNANNEEVELVFSPQSPERRRDIQQAGLKDWFKPNPVKLSKIKDWFKDFDVDSIELWLEGTGGTGKLTQLLISFEGKGGCKVTLKPKKNQ